MSIRRLTNVRLIVNHVDLSRKDNFSYMPWMIFSHDFIRVDFFRGDIFRGDFSDYSRAACMYW